MDKKTLRTLEYNKIIDLLCEHATCSQGKELWLEYHHLVSRAMPTTC